MPIMEKCDKRHHLALGLGGRKYHELAELLLAHTGPANSSS